MMQQLFNQLESMYCNQIDRTLFCHQVEEIINAIQSNPKQFESWFYNISSTDTKIKILSNIAGLLPSTSTNFSLSGAFIEQLSYCYSAQDYNLLKTFLFWIRLVAPKIKTTDTIGLQTIENILQQLTQYPDISTQEIIAILETLHLLGKNIPKDWSKLNPYIEFLIENYTYDANCQELQRLFYFLALICQTKTKVLSFMPINLLKQVCVSLNPKQPQQLLEFIKNLTIIASFTPMSTKDVNLEEIFTHLLKHNNLHHNQNLEILSNLSHLCHLKVFNKEFSMDLLGKLFQKILSKKLSQIDLINTLILIPEFTNYYHDQDKKNFILQIAKKIITLIDDNTFKTISPLQSQNLADKLSKYDELISFIKNKNYFSEFINHILSGNFQQFKTHLELMTEQEVLNSLVQSIDIQNKLLDYPYFPMYLEQILRNCSKALQEQLILQSTLDYFYLKCSPQTLNFITHVFMCLELHHNIYVLDRLFKLLQARKKANPIPENFDMCHQLQIIVLSHALDFYQKNNLNLEIHGPIQNNLNSLLKSDKPLSLKEMHAVQQVEFQHHSLMNSHGEPNLSEFYVELDVQHLLTTRLASNQMTGVMAALDPSFSVFNELMQLAIKNNIAYQNLIIPMHIGQHWVGIAICNIQHNKPLVIFYDSLPYHERAEQFKHLLIPIIQSVLKKSIEWLVKEDILIQEDASSCGAYLIENIARDFLGLEEYLPSCNLTIRQFHLTLLLEHHPEIYTQQYELACQQDAKKYAQELEYTPACMEKLLSLLFGGLENIHLLKACDLSDIHLNQLLLEHSIIARDTQCFILPILIEQQWIICAIHKQQISIFDTHPEKILEKKLKEKMDADIDFLFTSKPVPYIQTKDSDNGPLIVECVRQLLAPDTPKFDDQDIKLIRKVHLECFNQHAPEFPLNFSNQQRLNPIKAQP